MISMDKAYDTIIIGAGHNGLVAAAYLARAGKRVLVLEQRESLGGTLGKQDLGGFWVDRVQSGTLRPDIARDLRLNLPRPDESAEFISLLPGGKRLVLGRDAARTTDSIRQFSERDARRWPEFVRFMEQAARF